MARAKKKLEENIKAAGLTPTGVWYLSQYNSPWVFPLLRKNEVWIGSELIKNLDQPRRHSIR